MGVDFYDVVFRLKRTFGIRLTQAEFAKVIDSEQDWDILVDDLFELVYSKAVRTSLLDATLDAEAFWPTFQRAISNAVGVDPSEVTKGRWLRRDLDCGIC